MTHTTIETQHGVHVVKPTELLYEYDNRLLLAALAERIGGGDPPYVIIDLSQLRFINSVGLSFLINALTKTRNAGGELVLVQAPPSTRHLLAITKLQAIFTLFDELSDAFRYLTAQYLTKK